MTPLPVGFPAPNNLDLTKPGAVEVFSQSLNEAQLRFLNDNPFGKSFAAWLRGANNHVLFVARPSGVGVVPSVRNGTLSYNGTTIPVAIMGNQPLDLSVQPTTVPLGSDLHDLVSQNARNRIDLLMRSHAGEQNLSVAVEDDSSQHDSFASTAAPDVSVAPKFSQTAAAFFIA